MKKLLKINIFSKACPLLSHPIIRLMRLHKPLPILLLLFPCLWAIAFKATDWREAFFWGVIFTIGSILTRSAGCVINDILDKELDEKIARTSKRPLAANETTKLTAIKLFFLLMLASAILLIFLPYNARIIACLGAVMLSIYPLCKKYINYPQIFLGLTYNLGIIIAWLSLGGNFGYQIITLYIACIFWTIGYDAIYAFQDLQDDKRLGIKSIAIKFAGKPHEHIWLTYQIAASLLAINGFLANLNLGFFAVMAVAAYHLYWQTEYTDFSNQQQCQKTFNSNVVFGALVMVAILVGRW
jgi:4-hydroxybenzoate polyprenyl transferase